MPALPFHISQSKRQARYDLTSKPGKAKCRQKKKKTETNAKTPDSFEEIWEPHSAHLMRVVSKLHEAVANRLATQNPRIEHELEHEVSVKAEVVLDMPWTQMSATDLAVTPLKNADVMKQVAKVTALDNPKLDRPTRIPKYVTRHQLDEDIRKHTSSFSFRCVAGRMLRLEMKGSTLCRSKSKVAILLRRSLF
jgi:hypothetical protein